MNILLLLLMLLLILLILHRVTAESPASSPAFSPSIQFDSITLLSFGSLISLKLMVLDMILSFLDSHCYNHIHIMLSGIKAGKEQHHLHKKAVTAIVVATTALAALVFGFLCFWVYHSKYPTKSKTKNVQTPGFYSFIFHCSISHILVFVFQESISISNWF